MVIAMRLCVLLATMSSASAYKPNQRMSIGLWPMPVKVTALLTFYT